MLLKKIIYIVQNYVILNCQNKNVKVINWNGGIILWQNVYHFHYQKKENNVLQFWNFIHGKNLLICIRINIICINWQLSVIVLCSKKSVIPSGIICQIVKPITGRVDKIYTTIFSFFRKRVVNIAILELGLVSNESPGNFTFYICIRVFTNF